MSATRGAVERRKRPRGTLNEARWEEVLHAAEEVFVEKGYLASTLQDIASRVGMLKGSLYYYINSKEELLYEILYRSHRSGISYIQEDPTTARQSPPVRLEALIRRWMAGLVSRPPPYDISAYEFDHRYLLPEHRTEIRALRSEIAKVTESIVAEGVLDGSFHPSVQPYTAASTLLRTLNTTYSWVRPDGGQSWQQVTDWIVGLYLGGLVAGPSSFGRSVAGDPPQAPRIGG